MISFVFLDPGIQSLYAYMELVTHVLLFNYSTLPLPVKFLKQVLIYMLLLSAFVLAITLCYSNFFSLTLSDLITFKLCHSRKYSQHKLSLRCLCIDGFLLRNELYTLFARQETKKIRQLSTRISRLTDYIFKQCDKLEFIVPVFPCR